MLGSVTLSRPGAISSLPTALAPLLLLFVAWYVFRHWFEWFPSDLYHTLTLYGIMFCFCCGAIPSAQDVRAGCYSLAGLLLYVALAAAAAFFLCP